MKIVSIAFTSIDFKVLDKLFLLFRHFNKKKRNSNKNGDVVCNAYHDTRNIVLKLKIFLCVPSVKRDFV